MVSMVTMKADASRVVSGSASSEGTEDVRLMVLLVRGLFVSDTLSEQGTETACDYGGEQS